MNNHKAPNTEHLDNLPPSDNKGGEYTADYPEDRPRKNLKDMQKEAIIRFLEYLIDHLTWKRIVLIALLGICSIMLYTVYEQRNNIAQHILSQVVAGSVDRTTNNITGWALSDESKEAIRAFGDSNPVIFTTITEVNLKQNTRRVHFVSLTDLFPSSINRDTALNETQIVHTIFDYDPKNTAQMVAVLANEFRCDPYIDTIYHRAVPDGRDYIHTICRIAIPPYVGKFIGFISIGTSRALTKTEVDSIRLSLSRLAVEIYLRDVEKRPNTM